MVTLRGLPVNYLPDLFTTIKNGLKNSGENFDIIVNCNDDWLMYEKDRITKDGTRYRESLLLAVSAYQVVPVYRMN